MYFYRYRFYYCMCTFLNSSRSNASSLVQVWRHKGDKDVYSHCTQTILLMDQITSFMYMHFIYVRTPSFNPSFLFFSFSLDKEEGKGCHLTSVIIT